jgi:hypothetical protein
VKQIDVLSDDVLLEIFDFYVDTSLSYLSKPRIEAWQSLVHVCRRWRSLVLVSPRRLNLHLYCTPETRARDTQDIWPTIPLIIVGNMASSSNTDNIIATLGQSDRVSQVSLWGFASSLENVLAVMQVPFPELTYLRLRLFSGDKTPPVIPDSFLDGSAPRLRYFSLSGIPFPGLPNLLLSANHLVKLRLLDMPHSGYISPEAIVALLSVLSSLEIFSLGFQSPQSLPDRESRSLPPPKRFSLLALDKFHFRGVTEYLEDLLTFINAPQLKYLGISFPHQIEFDSPRLARFINRTPNLSKRDVHVQFHDMFARVELPAGSGTFEINISCREPDQQLSSIEQVCKSSLHPLSMVEDLYIEHQYSRLVWKNNAIENTLWLQLLRPFTAVKNLYLTTEFAPGIAAALQELVEGRIIEVLPNLENILVEGLKSSGPLQKKIGQFVAARKFPGHLIAISVWHKDSNMRSI